MADNPYLALIRDRELEPAGEGENPYFRLARELQASQGAALRQSVLASAATSPDRAAQVLDLARRTRLPAEIVERHFDEIARKARVEETDYDRLLREHPRLAEWLATRPEHAALAQDDLPTLTAFDRIVNEFSRGTLALRQQARGLLMAGGATQLQEIERIEAKLARGEPLVGNEGLYGLQFMTPEQRAALKAEIGAGLTRDIGRVAALEARQAEIPVDPVFARAFRPGNTFAEFWEAFSEKPVELTLQIIAQSAPQMVPGLVLGAAAGPVGLGFGSFGVDYAAEVLAALREAGVDLTDEAAVRAAVTDPGFMDRVARQALAHAGVVGSFDALSAGLAGKTLIPARVAARPGIGQAADLATQTVVQGVLGGLGEAGGTIAQGRRPEVAEVAAEVIAEAGTAVPETVAVSGRALRDRYSRAVEAKRAEAFFTALAEGVSTSKTAKRLPEALQSLLERLTVNGPVETTYLDPTVWQTYWQSQGVDPREVAREVLGDVAEYDQAVATGHDFAIPTARYAAKIAGTPHHAAFVKDLRLGSPDAMTAREAEQLEQALQRATTAEDVTEERQRTAAEQVREDVTGQLVGAGFRAAEAETNAQLVEAFFRTIGARAGMDPLGLFQRTRLRIERPLPEVLRRVGTTDALDALLDRLRAGDVPDERAGRGPSLLEALREPGLKGGVGEVDDLDINVQTRRVGKRNIVRDDGMTLDRAAEWAAERGYIPERDINLLLGAIREELSGRPTFAAGQEDPRIAETRAQLEELDAYLRSLGLNVQRLTNEEIKARLEGREAPTAEAGTEEAETLEQAGTRPQPAGEARALGTIRELDPNTLVFREAEQHHLDEVREAFPPGAGYYPIVTILDADGGRRILDGHNRAAVARERGDLIPAVDVLEAEYEALTREGFDDIEIAYAALDRAGADEAASALNRQFPGAGVDERGTAAARRLDELPEPALENIVEFEQRAARGPRGALTITPDRQFLIRLFQSADLSTFLHESGHLFLEVLGDVVEELNARDAELTPSQEALVRDYQTLLGFLGVTSRAEITREHHERFARTFEAYLFKGEAPSVGLRRAFARFRTWLIGVYRAIKQAILERRLDVRVTPQIQRVLDRLLATDEEIAAAEAEAELTPVFTTAEQAGMTEAEFAVYRETVAAASRTARETLQARLLAELTREQEAWWKEQREAVRAEVEAEVDAQPVYIALSVLQRGKRPDGTPLPIKLDRQALVDRYGVDFLKRLPRPYVYALEGGMDPDRAAEVLGFSSGDELVTALVNARPRRQLIEAETDERMRERFGDLLTHQAELAEAARAAVMNDEREKVLRAELAALRRKAAEVRPFVRQAREEARAEGEAAGRRAGIVEGLRFARREEAERRREGVRAVREGVPSPEQLAQIARAVVARKRVGDLRPGVYLVAARRASQAAVTAAARDDFATAAAAKRTEVLNLALYRETARVREEMERAVERLRRYRTPSVRARIGRAGESYLEQIDAILERFELARVSQRELARRQSLQAWIIEQERQDLPVELDERLIDEAFRQPYQTLTVEELRGVRDGVEHIAHLARLKVKLLTTRAKQDLAETVDEMVATIEANVPALPPAKISAERTAGDRARRWLQGFIAAHRKLSSWARQMDGGVSGGPVWEGLVRPLNEAANREVTMRREAAERQQALWNAWRRSGRKRLQDKVYIPAIGQSLSLEARLAVALNWGNEGNRERLMAGEKWTEAQVQAILDTLDEADWTLVQGIWDHIESYWPEIAEKQRRVTGVAPEKVEPLPVVTRVGTFRGGYYPIKYDPERSPLAFRKEAETAATLYALGEATRATTRRSHTKARTQGLGRPLRLDLDVLTQHLAQVIHDLTHHEAILDVSRLLRHDRLATAIQDHLGPEALRQMEAVVKDVAAGDLADTTVDRALRWIRNGVSVANIGFNLSTVLLQPTGIGQSMQLVGARPFGRAVARIFGNPFQTASAFEFVREKSPFMRERAATVLREAREVLDQVRGATWRERLSAWSYYPMLKAQWLVDVPTWFAAYDEALRAGRSDEDAVAIADQAVIDTQGSGLVKDLAGVQRARATQLFTVFYSYFSATFNRTAEAVAAARRQRWSPEAIAHLTMDLLFLYLVPGAMTALVRALREEEDEEDTFAAAVAKETIGQAMGTVVVLRELTGVVTDGYDYRGPAGTLGLDAIADVVIQARQGELDEGLAKAAAKAVGILGHLPTQQAVRSIEGFMAVQERGVGPQAVLVGPPRE